MYFEKYNNKKITSFSQIIDGKRETVLLNEKLRKFIYEVDYRGDYSIHWIVIYDLEGNEISRINDRYVERISFDLEE